MAGLDLHYAALEQCRTNTKKVAGKFDDLDRAYPAATTDSLIFGKLTDSSTLATAVDGIEKTIGAEAGFAKSKLEAVERALDTVQENVRDAHKATSDGGRK
ncbi:hypothetical protein [Streptosporangium sp. NPDC000396]|uniref:hypothetical protein n=1 Tax=Streptosporangium sp. NPDC000396 TaxID=3366185 RepID=UPI0036C03B00